MVRIMTKNVHVKQHARRTMRAQPVYLRRTPVSEWPKEKMTRSNGGKPLRVVMDEHSIYAYRAEPAQVISTKFEGDESRIEIEPTLSKYFTEEPVMTIRKLWATGDFNVDFEAGFQRGRITVGVDELCKKSQWPKRNGAGYLKWIGLSCNDPDVKAWLERD